MTRKRFRALAAGATALALGLTGLAAAHAAETDPVWEIADSISLAPQGDEHGDSAAWDLEIPMAGLSQWLMELRTGQALGATDPNLDVAFDFVGADLMLDLTYTIELGEQIRGWIAESGLPQAKIDWLTKLIVDGFGQHPSYLSQALRAAEAKVDLPHVRIDHEARAIVVGEVLDLSEGNEGLLQLAEGDPLDPEFLLNALWTVEGTWGLDGLDTLEGVVNGWIQDAYDCLEETLTGFAWSPPDVQIPEWMMEPLSEFVRDILIQNVINPVLEPVAGLLPPGAVEQITARVFDEMMAVFATTNLSALSFNVGEWIWQGGELVMTVDYQFIIDHIIDQVIMETIRGVIFGILGEEAGKLLWNDTAPIPPSCIGENAVILEDGWVAPEQWRFDEIDGALKFILDVVEPILKGMGIDLSKFSEIPAGGCGVPFSRDIPAKSGILFIAGIPFSADIDVYLHLLFGTTYTGSSSYRTFPAVTVEGYTPATKYGGSDGIEGLGTRIANGIRDAVGANHEFDVVIPGSDFHDGIGGFLEGAKQALQQKVTEAKERLADYVGDEIIGDEGRTLAQWSELFGEGATITKVTVSNLGAMPVVIDNFTVNDEPLDLVYSNNFINWVFANWGNHWQVGYDQGFIDGRADGLAVTDNTSAAWQPGFDAGAASRQGEIDQLNDALNDAKGSMPEGWNLRDHLEGLETNELVDVLRSLEGTVYVRLTMHHKHIPGGIGDAIYVFNENFPELGATTLTRAQANALWGSDATKWDVANGGEVRTMCIISGFNTETVQGQLEFNETVGRAVGASILRVDRVNYFSVTGRVLQLTDEQFLEMPEWLRGHRVCMEDGRPVPCPAVRVA